MMYCQYWSPCAHTVSDLDVLPLCDFKALYAYPHRVKAYTGVNHVKGSYVYPKDDTWFKNWHQNDKGNAVIEKKVCVGVTFGTAVVFESP